MSDMSAIEYMEDGRVHPFHYLAVNGYLGEDMVPVVGHEIMNLIRPWNDIYALPAKRKQEQPEALTPNPALVSIYDQERWDKLKRETPEEAAIRRLEQAGRINERNEYVAEREAAWDEQMRLEFNQNLLETQEALRKMKERKYPSPTESTEVWTSAIETEDGWKIISISPDVDTVVPTTEGRTMSNGKIHYQRWLYGKYLIGKLKKSNFSLTEISSIAVGHGETPGWTTAARENRSVMKERHISTMEKFLAPKRKKGRVKGDSDLSADQRRIFRKMLMRLNVRFEWTTRQIADALGYTNLNSVSRALKRGGGGGSMTKLTILTSIMDALNAEVQDAMDTAEDQAAIEEVEDQTAIEESIDGSPHHPEHNPTLNGVGTFETAMGSARTTGKTFLDTLHEVERNMPPFMEGNMKVFIKQVEDIVDQLG